MADQTSRVLTMPGALTALAPIHHGGDEKTGNVRVLRTIRTWDPAQGRSIKLPIISGNAIRGVLRRLLMHDLYARLEREAVSGKEHHALFTGGALEGGDSSVTFLDIKDRRRFVAMLPPLGLLGSAIGSEMFDGCLRVGHALPVCAETAWLLAAQGHDPARLDAPVRSFRDFTFTTRSDDLREPGGDSHQMIVSFETFAPGTRFAHRLELRHASPEEAGALAHAVALWRESPYIGGKSASGFGELMIAYDGLPDAGPYLDHVAAQRAEINRDLDQLAVKLGGIGKAKQTALAAAG